MASVSAVATVDGACSPYTERGASRWCGVDTTATTTAIDEKEKETFSSDVASYPEPVLAIAYTAITFSDHDSTTT